jgi:predicted nucleotidyltransferase
MSDPQIAILELLQNYAQCEYPLSLGQIHCMLTVQIEQEELREILHLMLHQQLVSIHKTHHWYVIRGHEISFRRREERSSLSENKQTTLDKFTKLLCVCPWIYTVTLTGSLALDNAKASDDIDLMIITAPDTMFLCRLYASVIANLLGLARKRLVETQPDAICVNIWLDSSDLGVPKSKVSVYSAREIVNARVIIDKNDIFGNFISANKWIFEKLPNWDVKVPRSTFYVPSSNTYLKRLNNLLGRIQLWYMRPHITHEIVGKTQLWFHPKIRY